MSKTCGIDWSERHHDVAVVDEDARVVVRARVGDTAGGFGQLLELLAEHSDEGDPGSIDVAIESDKGLFVAALIAAGFTVFAINPRRGALSGAIRPGRWQNPTPVMPCCSRISCAPIGTCTARCRPTPRRRGRSRRPRVSTRRRSGHGNRR